MGFPNLDLCVTMVHDGTWYATCWLRNQPIEVASSTPKTGQWLSVFLEGSFFRSA